MCFRKRVIPFNVNLRMANWVTVQKLTLGVNKDQQAAIYTYQTYDLFSNWLAFYSKFYEFIYSLPTSICSVFF